MTADMKRVVYLSITGDGSLVLFQEREREREYIAEGIS
jgi:hypothetical protein